MMGNLRYKISCLIEDMIFYLITIITIFVVIPVFNLMPWLVVWLDKFDDYLLGVEDFDFECQNCTFKENPETINWQKEGF